MKSECFNAICLVLGVVCYINCSDEILVSYFLIADGVLSVFVFPILVMVWTKRVGGCVGQEEKVESGSFWISLLVFRILLTASGNVPSLSCIYIFISYNYFAKLINFVIL